jgi:hypothetical protein
VSALGRLESLVVVWPSRLRQQYPRCCYLCILRGSHVSARNPSSGDPSQCHLYSPSPPPRLPVVPALLLLILTCPPCVSTPLGGRACIDCRFHGLVSSLGSPTTSLTSWFLIKVSWRPLGQKHCEYGPAWNDTCVCIMASCALRRSVC